jgi:glucosylceramidase
MKKFRIFFILSVLNCLFTYTICGQEAEIWLTKSDKSALFNKQNQKIKFNKKSSDIPTIFVDDSKVFQTMEGFGYTLTGGSAQLIYNFPEKSSLLTELFRSDENNIGVSYLRISIGASDLDSHVFSYSDKKGEFSLLEDEKYLIPVLKEILKINPKIKILGSPWSPPIWMKSNQNSVGGSLMAKNFNDYAQYLSQYVSEMQKKGIKLDAITVQNEPLHPGNNPSLLMLASEQADFIKNHLGPVFKAKNIKTKIIIYDHNADRPDFPISILNDQNARKYISGSAFHLYGGNVESIGEVHEAHPDKDLYFTEQWVGHPSNFGGDLIWHIKNLIIGATKNWCKTVLEWNLASDPDLKIHTDGGCTACLGAITIDHNKLERNAAYYIIAHASKFVRPGSKRIASNTTLGLYNVAFLTPENKKVLIVLNDSDQKTDFGIGYKNQKTNYTLDPKSVATIIW